jgi:16S rRNA (cytidine1402-2'-O)-methyltransferase
MKLYLIPTPLGDDAMETIPSYVQEITHSLSHFIVERAKTARHFIKATKHPIPMPELELVELNEHEQTEAVVFFKAMVKADQSVGLMSEAGCPAVADPGAAIVALAHQLGVTVVPLVGPSSILLALMGSGFSGQQFCFHGYLSAKQPAAELKQLETESQRKKQTQIFIETPYRNRAMVDAAFKNLAPNTRFCIAMDLTLPTEYIKTYKISEWKSVELPEIHKKPAVFLLFA